MSFAAQGVVPPQAAFALVLGANLGTALNPLFEAGSTGDPAAKRLPIGNLLNRAGRLRSRAGAARRDLALAGLVRADTLSRAVADFHTLFNLVMAALFFPVLGPLARLLKWMLPARAVPTDPSRPVYLDQAALEIPAVALAAASREALRMADVLETMLHAALEALDRGDRKKIAETKRLDDVLDRLNSAIKAYLTSLDHEITRRRGRPSTVGDPRFHHQPRTCRRHRRTGCGGESRKAGQAQPDIFDRRNGRNPRDAAASCDECAHRGCRVHDRRRARRARAARREGGVPRSRNARDRGAFRAHSRRPDRERRDQRAPPRHAARPQADQCAYCGRCLSGPRTTRRVAAEPAQARFVSGGLNEGARKEEAVGEKPGPRSDHRAGNGDRRRAHRSKNQPAHRPADRVGRATNGAKVSRRGDRNRYRSGARKARGGRHGERRPAL